MFIFHKTCYIQIILKKPRFCFPCMSEQGATLGTPTLGHLWVSSKTILIAVASASAALCWNNQNFSRGLKLGHIWPLIDLISPPFRSNVRQGCFMPVWCRQLHSCMPAGPYVTIVPRHEDQRVLHTTAHLCCPFHCLGWSPPPIAASGIDTTTFSAPGWPSVATKFIKMEPHILLERWWPTMPVSNKVRNSLRCQWIKICYSILLSSQLRLKGEKCIFKYVPNWEQLSALCYLEQRKTEAILEEGNSLSFS